MDISVTHTRRFFPLQHILILSLPWAASLLAPPARAQRELAGSAKAELDLRRLAVTGSALMIAAHPDDENTALLAWLARGRKVRTGYLSLTRGEGGQNLIGTEQGDAMGVIRTQELLAARRIDGAEQFFTRAIDFGFTKTPQEAIEKWGREQTLGDIVWVIRRFQPDVVILRFSGTPRDGHGQHQASAILGKEAYLAAADATRFPEQLKWVHPWKAKRLMWNAFAFTPEQQKEAEKLPGRIEVDPGVYDPLLGYSYRQIAGMSRTMHRSQGMGAAERPGASKEFLTLVAGDAPTKDLFDGVDLSWNRVPGGAPVGDALAKAIEVFAPDHPENSVAPLLDARRLAASLDDPLAKRKLESIDDAIALCAGIWLEAASDRYAYVPGASAKITATEVNRGPLPVESLGVDLDGAVNKPAKPLQPNTPLAVELTAQVAADAPYSQPYWLREPKHGDRYTVADPLLIGQPENPPLYKVTFRFRFGADRVDISRPVVYRFVDHQRGEQTRPLAIVPPVAIQLAGAAMVFGSPEPREVEVELKSAAPAQSGSLRLTAPEGWKIDPPSREFSLPEAGQESALRFRVTPPTADSSGKLKASADANGRGIAVATDLIAYSHIPPQYMFPPAAATLVRSDIKVDSRSIGYIMGAGDEVPAALRQIGCNVTLLSAEDLATADFARFDAIVTGIRAYNVRADLRANQPRLLDYVKQGGTMVVQYNTLDGGGVFGGDPHLLDHVGPYQIKFSHDRVTVEDAPVKVLDPSSPLLHRPNQISETRFHRLDPGARPLLRPPVGPSLPAAL